MRPPSRVLSALLGIGALVVGSTVASPAAATEPPDPVVTVLPPESVVAGAPTPVADGPFDMVVEVTGGVAQDLTVTPRLPSWRMIVPVADPVTIPAGTCPASCRLSWRIDPADQATPWNGGVHPLDVTAVMADRSIQTYSSAVDYRPVVQATWVAEVSADPTVNTSGNSPSVFDTGGEVIFGGAPARETGEQVRVSVLPAEGDFSAPLVSVSGTWGPDDPDTGYATGRARIDTSGLPEGRYRVLAQAHDGAGHWSFATAQTIVVVHSPLVHAEPDGPGIVATGRDIAVTVTVRGLRLPDRRPGTVTVTVGGVEHIIPADTSDWYVPSDTAQPSSRSVAVPTVGLAVGPAAVDVEVLDVDGVPIGTGSATIEVVDFHETVSVPTLIVGRPASVRLGATAPSGAALLECWIHLKAPLEHSAISNLCPGPRATSVNASQSMVPWNAGSGTLRLKILAHDGVVGPEREFPVRVYANRTASVSAPWRAVWGSTQTATVRVLDEKRLGVRSAAGSDLTVTLQRKNAGTSTWTTIGRATTGSTGVAVVRYRHTSSGRLRALVKGAAPGVSVRTPERSTTSVARVAWSSLPASTRSGSVVTAAVYARPYEKGATIRFQARKVGTWRWTTFGSGAVATSGYAKASGRLWTKGTWDVRIQRVGTKTQATGYSSVRRIKIT